KWPQFLRKLGHGPGTNRSESRRIKRLHNYWELILGEYVSHELKDGQSDRKVHYFEGPATAKDFDEMEFSRAAPSIELVQSAGKLLEDFGHQVWRDHYSHPGLSLGMQIRRGVSQTG